MGIIRAAVSTVKGSLEDQWLEVVEPYEMDAQTVCTRGVVMRKGREKKGSPDVLSNGSVIHVDENQFMILTDGGRIIDYTAEPGYYTIEDFAQPSMFSGQFGEALKDTFNRFRFGGGTPQSQKVYYINLQEITGIRFGTRNPVNYFDSFYNAELFLRAHGTYSIRIVDPLLFYAEAVPRNAERVEVQDINEQFLNEFLEGIQVAVNRMSADGIRISYVASKSTELSRYMADALDDSWRARRGMEVQSVAIASISYDEESQKLIHMRNQGAMLQDPVIREGYLQGAAGRAMEAAASNPNGSMAGFMGLGMGMQSGGNILNAASAVNAQQMQNSQPGQNWNQAAPQGQPGQSWSQAAPQSQPGQSWNQAAPQDQPDPMQNGSGVWTCGCGAENTGNFCTNCGKPRPAAAWICSCGTANTGNFCSNCGKPRQ